MASRIHTTEADVQREMISLAGEQGWSFVGRKEMNALRGDARMNEAIVEPLLVEAIESLNPWLDEEGVREIAARVRRISSDRDMLGALRNGVPYKAAPDQPTKDVVIVASAEPSRNAYVVTEEFAIRTGGRRDPRLDVVFLVNGIPLGAFENKDTSEPLSSAADDWRGYWGDAPPLVAQVSVAGCCNGIHAAIGPSGLEEIDGYMEWTDPWPRELDDPDDPMLAVLAGAFHPHTLVDLAVNFVLFETREGETTKKLARAHQHRAANKIVTRVVEGQFDRGIVWHATGSGKSLTMVFAARKLMRSGLGNPTVLIVIDRTELDEQISETLTACEFQGVERAEDRRHLEALLRKQTGGVVVTTVHKFDEEMAYLLLRREVIGFVDEAHRTQFGKFATWMRKALPRSFLFGFTGTPIEQTARSTRAEFSPVGEDGTYEAYLDRYGFDEATADGATVALVYEPRLVDWQLAVPDLDQRLAELTPDLSDEERDALREQAVTERVIAKSPLRVAAVVRDVVALMRERIGPLSLVGQLVVVDREACALVAEELSKLLGDNEFAVIMSRSKKDSAPRLGDVDLRRWYPATQWERAHGRGPQVADGEDEEQEAEEGFTIRSDRAAIKDFVARFKRDSDPLSLLVVNNMLITGFDAPNEGALFLDRGLTGHTLIQAINRPNRRHPGKDVGFVFDYWGLFSNLSEALAEFAREDLRGLVEDSEALVARFPEALAEAEDLIGSPPEVSPRRRMLWLVRRLTDDPATAERFEALVREAQAIFEILTPDPRLAAHIKRYEALLELWTAWVRGTRRDRGDRDELRHKTRRLVQESIGLKRIRDDLPAATIGPGFLSALKEAEELTPEDRATEIEAAVVHEIKVRGEDDPLAKTLAERLAQLRERQEREAELTLEMLAEWERLVRQHVEEQAQAEQLGLAPAGAIALAVLRRGNLDVDDRVLVEAAREIALVYQEVAGFEGWSQRSDVVQGLRKVAIKRLVVRPETRPLTLDGEILDELLAGLATLDAAI